MYPVLFKLGRFTLNTYTVFFALALCAALLLTRSEARRRGWDVRSSSWMVLRCSAVGFVGAHLLYCLTRLELPPSEWWDAFLRLGYGNVWYGGFFAGWLVIRHHASAAGIRKLELYDSVALAAALAQGIGRIGCFFGGCCFGSPTSLPWGVVALQGEQRGLRVHPWPLYESVYALLLFGWLWRVRMHRQPGHITVHYLLYAGIGRFVLELWRGDSIRGFVVLGLSTSQVCAIALVMLVTASYGWTHRKAWVVHRPWPTRAE